MKLQPLAATYGVRIIALNRREYPGSVPYTAEERALFPPVPDKPLTDADQIRSAQQMLGMFMRDRARELYQTVEGLVVERNLPPAGAGSQTSGIVLVGWSMGATWMMALLTHIAEFPVGAVNLRDYVRRIVLSGMHRTLPVQTPIHGLTSRTQTHRLVSSGILTPRTTRGTHSSTPHSRTRSEGKSSLTGSPRTSCTATP